MCKIWIFSMNRNIMNFFRLLFIKIITRLVIFNFNTREMHKSQMYFVAPCVSESGSSTRVELPLSTRSPIKNFEVSEVASIC